jgi:hypothetical protein
MELSTLFYFIKPAKVVYGFYRLKVYLTYYQNEDGMTGYTFKMEELG